jgi:hypothetical protein
MACCTEDGRCPMHTAGSDEDAASRVVTQAEADLCCAASEPDDSSSSPSGFALLTTFGAVTAVPALLLQAESRGKLSRTSVPIPTTHVAKHLLLSVFLV